MAGMGMHRAKAAFLSVFHPAITLPAGFDAALASFELLPYELLI
jgi:hypothetical protein